MRDYIRHPSDIPIQYHVQETGIHIIENLNNISQGGLCFRSTAAIKNNTPVMISIPIINPGIQMSGIVVWCQPSEDAFEIGIKFLDEESAFRIRLIEQICYIEHYRREVLLSEGRHLDSEQAAVEWIEKFASDFPS